MQDLDEKRALAENAMEDVDLLIEGEPVGWWGGAHRPIVERDEPAATRLGLGAGCARPADLGVTRVYGAGKAIC